MTFLLKICSCYTVRQSQFKHCAELSLNYACNEFKTLNVYTMVEYTMVLPCFSVSLSTPWFCLMSPTLCEHTCRQMGQMVESRVFFGVGAVVLNDVLYAVGEIRPTTLSVRSVVDAEC